MSGQLALGLNTGYRDDLTAWEESFVTTLLISGDAALLRQAAEIVLG